MFAAVGGYLDAYTYVGRGHVFANAQTGNVVLGAIDLAGARWGSAVARLPSLAAFLIGLYLVQSLARPRWRARVRRPARVALGVEIVVLAVVGGLPRSVPDAVVTALVAFAAAVQVTTIRSVGGVAYTTTMTTGNLRQLIANLARWRFERDRAAARAAGVLGLVVVCFAAGAALGAVATHGLGDVAVYFAVGALVVAFAVIVGDTRRRERSAGAEQGGDLGVER